MTSKNSQIKKFTAPLTLIVLNATNFWNSFHGQTFLKDTIFSALKFGVKMLLISLRNAMMDIYFLTLQYIE